MRFLISTLALFYICTSLSWLVAQQAIVVTGQDISGAGGSVHCTIGQVAQQILEGETIWLIEGVQQGFSLSVTTEDYEKHPAINGRIYPNPASESITLALERVEDRTLSDLQIHICDMHGRILLHKRVDEVITHVLIHSLPPGTYLLRMSVGDSAYQNFIFIKT